MKNNSCLVIFLIILLILLNLHLIRCILIFIVFLLILLILDFINNIVIRVIVVEFLLKSIWLIDFHILYRLLFIIVQNSTGMITLITQANHFASSGINFQVQICLLCKQFCGYFCNSGPNWRLEFIALFLMQQVQFVQRFGSNFFIYLHIQVSTGDKFW